MAVTARFAGFPKELPAFLKKLERNNNKAWFDAHRDDYEALYLEPAKAFASAMVPALRTVGKDITCEPRVNGAIMRINRDVRFSKDKTPYKTALHFRFPSGDPRDKGGSGLFLRVASNSLTVAGGAFGFDPKKLDRYRRAVVDPKQGKALRVAIDKVLKAGPYALSDPDLKRVPKGFDPEHPNAELLRFKGFYAHADLPMPKAIFGSQAVPHVIAHFKKLRPVQDWLCKALA